MQWLKTATCAKGIAGIGAPNLAPQGASRTSSKDAQLGSGTRGSGPMATQEAPSLAPAVDSRGLSQIAPANPARMVGKVVIHPPAFVQLDGKARLAIQEAAAKRRGRSSIKVRRIWDVQGKAPPIGEAAAEHAYRLLSYLQDQPILAGHLVPARDLERLYGDFCLATMMAPESWQTVALYLNRFTGGKRIYRRINGRNTRVYFVPPKGERTAAG